MTPSISAIIYVEQKILYIYQPTINFPIKKFYFIFNRRGMTDKLSNTGCTFGQQLRRTDRAILFFIVHCVVNDCKQCFIFTFDFTFTAVCVFIINKVNDTALKSDYLDL